ncbi:Metallo-dependent phosphatase [Coprinopsis marcescibilis]|uniref:Metallo-dependent phosphatase n=1 Tax=Coprinopsis marcescibilis TaxID=230819 RepID=A0A5C3KQK1_COPMA|nr:Metallo-dependent phosphatase [Coprinopsis marcescibilis]
MESDIGAEKTRYVPLVSESLDKRNCCRPGVSTVLNIAHFNDVYQVSSQKINKDETIDVTKFASLLESITDKWEERDEGLIVFSGDLFSPSIESSITRGRHMPRIINNLNVDIAIVGNHEFDFGYPRLAELVNLTAFPWLLSNILDEDTGTIPKPLKEFHIVERAGLRIGLIGLVEKDWIPTIAGWPPNFTFLDMAETGRRLSRKLRDEHRCDLVIALTHSRCGGFLWPLRDITLARDLLALSPSAQATTDITSEHGVDLLLGGHDHIYWITKGVTEWDGYDVQTPLPDAADDRGDVLIVKSGTDFQDISEVVLTVRDTPPRSVRRKVITQITGKRHTTAGRTPVHPGMKEVYDKEIGTIDGAMKDPICITEVELNVKSSFIRVHESPISNWVADCLRHAYDEALVRLGYGRADGVLLNSGGLRGDRVYSPGKITLGDLMTIVPYLDPVVVSEIDGNTLWDALESGLSKWPAQEGRFPQISGFRVEWDHGKPPGERVSGIWLLSESSQVGADGVPVLVDLEPVTRASTRKYLIVTGEYLTQGGDGYDALKDGKLVINGENGQSKSQLLRKYLAGVQLLNRKLATADTSQAQGCTTVYEGSSTVGPSSRQLAGATFSAAETENLCLLDPYERSRAREEIQGQGESMMKLGEEKEKVEMDPELVARLSALNAAEKEAIKTLPVIRPMVDGRLRDLGAGLAKA